jgi:hypothetical protein
MIFKRLIGLSIIFISISVPSQKNTPAFSLSYINNIFFSKTQNIMLINKDAIYNFLENSKPKKISQLIEIAFIKHFIFNNKIKQPKNLKKLKSSKSISNCCYKRKNIFIQENSNNEVVILFSKKDLPKTRSLSEKK